MKRPRYDLTWRAIRRRWAVPEEQSNPINGPMDNHHLKSPSAPLLNSVAFESLSNNVINVEQEPLQFGNEREKQSSDADLEFSSPSRQKIRHSNHYQDLLKISHTCDMEMIRSELRLIISQLETLTQHTRQQEEEEDESEDWKFVAMVIDRLCLVLFTASMVIFTGLTLFASPNFFKLH